MATELVHIHRPAPVAAVVLGMGFLLLIGLPGLVLAPTGQSAAGFLVCAALAGALGLLLRIRVEFRCDLEARSLRMLSVRWPLSPGDRVLGLDAIRAVRVVHTGRGGGHAVVLELFNGETVNVPGGGSASSAHEETAEVLQRWLAQLPAPAVTA